MGRLTDEELKSLDIYENENDIWIGKEHHILSKIFKSWK